MTLSEQWRIGGTQELDSLPHSFQEYPIKVTENTLPKIMTRISILYCSTTLNFFKRLEFAPTRQLANLRKVTIPRSIFPTPKPP